MRLFIHRIFSRDKNAKRKNESISISVSILGQKYTVKSSDSCVSKKNLKHLQDRRTSLHNRHERRMRHKKIWAVLNYAKCLEAVHCSQNFYDLDNALLNYQGAIARLYDPEFRPSIDHLTCAFRFCDIKYSQGACEYHLTADDKKHIANWTSNTLDYVSILKTVSERFIESWDGILDKYSRINDKKERLEYLIHHLEEVKHRKGLSTIPSLDDYLNRLRAYYTNCFREM